MACKSGGVACSGASAGSRATGQNAKVAAKAESRTIAPSERGRRPSCSHLGRLASPSGNLPVRPPRTVQAEAGGAVARGAPFRKRQSPARNSRSHTHRTTRTKECPCLSSRGRLDLLRPTTIYSDKRRSACSSAPSARPHPRPRLRGPPCAQAKERRATPQVTKCIRAPVAGAESRHDTSGGRFRRAGGGSPRSFRAARRCRSPRPPGPSARRGRRSSRGGRSSAPSAACS